MNWKIFWVTPPKQRDRLKTLCTKGTGWNIFSFLKKKKLPPAVFRFHSLWNEGGSAENSRTITVLIETYRWWLTGKKDEVCNLCQPPSLGPRFYCCFCIRPTSYLGAKDGERGGWKKEKETLLTLKSSSAFGDKQTSRWTRKRVTITDLSWDSCRHAIMIDVFIEVCKQLFTDIKEIFI